VLRIITGNVDVLVERINVCALGLFLSISNTLVYSVVVVVDSGSFFANSFLNS
jgi:hypothetical protein